MDPMLDADQQSYQESLRKFLDKHWDADRLRESMAGPNEVERQTWRRLAGELGLAGLSIPERFGGWGDAAAESLIATEELGSVLFGAFHLSTVVLGANAIVLSGDESVAEMLLPGVADGSITLALAHPERGRDRAARHLPSARRIDGGWSIDGEVPRVLDAATADSVLVVAEDEGTRSLFLLDDAEGLEIVPVETLDPTRRMATVTMTGVRATLVGRAGDADDLLRRLAPRVALHLAAEAVGGAATCVRETVAYVKTREQFGRPVGSFQAVKHRCADMQLRLEGARAGVRVAGRDLAAGAGGIDRLASVLKVYATESYFRSAADMVQLHGGIGFTWEHGAHLHFKRAKSLELLGGTSAEHRAALADDVLGVVS